jgi:hypothetical protein
MGYGEWGTGSSKGPSRVRALIGVGYEVCDNLPQDSRNQGMVDKEWGEFYVG